MRFSKTWPLFCAASALLFNIPRASRAASIATTNDGYVAVVDGTTFVTNTYGSVIEMELASFEREVGVFDFPLASVPPTALLSSATFSFYCSGLSLPPAGPVLSIEAYQSDGTIGSADALKPGIVVAQLNPAALGTYNVPLSSALLQPLLAADSYVAIRIEDAALGTSFDISSIEGELNEPPAALSLTFLPEPAVVGVLAIVFCAWFARPKRKSIAAAIHR